MGLSDDKFAWRKTHPINGKVRDWLLASDPIPYDELVGATDERSARDASMTTFLTGSGGAEKGLYTIFQYGIVLQRDDGRVALFGRVADDKGHGTRNLTGQSMLVSGSRMMTPTEALESICAAKLSFGRDEPAGTVEPLGFAFHEQARRQGIERANYLFALYRIRVTTNRLNGLVRENPDTFHGWRDPVKLTAEELDGAIDRVLLEHVLRSPVPAALLRGAVMYQPGCRLVDARQTPMDVAPFAVNKARTVFISHDAAAQLKAFLLRDVLLQRSRQRLHPFLDLQEVLPNGQRFWPRIENLIESSDVFLVLVTEGTAASEGVQKEIDYALALQDPPEIVIVHVDGTNDDVPQKIRDRNIFDYRGRQYRMWHGALGALIDNLFERPFRAGSLRPKDVR